MLEEVTVRIVRVRVGMERAMYLSVVFTGILIEIRNAVVLRVFWIWKGRWFGDGFSVGYDEF